MQIKHLLTVAAVLALFGCSAGQPWERTWRTDWQTLRNEPPYLWCGMETPEMARRLIGAFPLGSSRLEVRATIERLGLGSLIEKPVSASLDRVHVTAGGIVYPARPAGDDDVVLHLGNWAKWEPGVIKCFATCPYFVWFRFDSDVLSAVELRQHHVVSRDAPDASLEYWREAARRGVVVFTFGVPENL